MKRVSKKKKKKKKGILVGEASREERDTFFSFKFHKRRAYDAYNSNTGVCPL